jgi:hypothetical protein
VYNYETTVLSYTQVTADHLSGGPLLQPRPAFTILITENFHMQHEVLNFIPQTPRLISNGQIRVTSVHRTDLPDLRPTESLDFSHG